MSIHRESYKTIEDLLSTVLFDNTGAATLGCFEHTLHLSGRCLF